MSVRKKVPVDSDEVYRRIDLLYGTEEQLTSVCKIKERFLREMCQNPSEEPLSLSLSLRLLVAVFLQLSLHHQMFLIISPQRVPCNWFVIFKSVLIDFRHENPH
jgi:hypothetical protein